jgi:hypothetical protein
MCSLLNAFWPNQNNETALVAEILDTVVFLMGTTKCSGIRRKDFDR